jgi:LmbE family N-acetylglucosaminyl deacetylase
MTALLVFSHPNHEVSMLGSIGRKAPNVVFLTDGGGEQRIQETQRGLSAYLPEDALHFLRRPEWSLYEALVEHDVEFYRELSTEVGAIIDRLHPEEIYCDAVEFYNPVHDMTLPVVRAACRESNDVAVFEVPLIYQRAAALDSFELQRVPPSLEPHSVSITLSEEELARKLAVLRGGIYQTLFSQMGPLILDAVATRAPREQFMTARQTLPEPEPDQALRYDRRGLALQASGAVRAAIGYREHYVPMFASLCADCGPPGEGSGVSEAAARRTRDPAASDWGRA